ncbi:MAG: 16S rRNA (adenine(1518)-N(6)/adenine(1519)-N(6))-dimethyltransferase RsmA [Bacteroidota bacterium]|nr:16S rRNA (adenine(1518)-N(6)/adenine(1519)-N(6))-dimethyltransferase RsmA [Bacteroidota bacterium]
MFVKPKKSLGQHFLTDDNIAAKIVNSLTFHNNYKNVVEIGPGMGVLTKFLLQNNNIDLYVIDIDKESTDFLKIKMPALENRIINADFLKYNLESQFTKPIGIIGNFPYNISTQILFKVLESRNLVYEIVGMFQKEVAVRIASKPGNKDYGILSVLMQAYYNTEYLFSVSEQVFNPPPKVKSGVIRFVRNNNEKLDCDEKLFFEVVKTAFNQRRKTIRNSLNKYNIDSYDSLSELLKKRAEELNVKDFIFITNQIKM